ncbi:TetR family transcriptional regulator [Amycolatopsis sp. H20-H5]|uniref:TetR family transcriptional regulator n=1 Tax=Amycolatopsis sp. H20-H5 TaxID=3046309 RepID=UPI002DBE84A2|nr:TetR family transcriptional regulator [Amycolatopsis sp. H20-H5]MEC3979112.1 TetR family transcriptional regulator [Amycolatopsis sp. H20-H5]
MSTGTSVAPALRERLLAEAAELTRADGWASVTMGKLAARAGVSRQTVYNELGSKPELAEALMLRETDGFATGVGDVLARHPADPVAGVTAAVRYALEAAQANPLLRTVLSGSSGGRESLLPLLTTRSGPVLEQAVAAIAPMLRQCYPAAPLTPDEWTVAVESLVRLLLSHLVRPTAGVDDAAERMGWVVARLLGG